MVPLEGRDGGWQDKIRRKRGKTPGFAMKRKTLLRDRHAVHAVHPKKNYITASIEDS